MPRDNSIPGSPREWLARAKGSLAQYPGTVEAITEEEYQEAIHLAEAVVSWADRMLEQEEEGDQ